jgi:hypothetical protein
MAKKTAKIDVAMCERVAGSTGMLAIVAGLRQMKEWAALHDRTFKYGARSMRFTFASSETADSFRATFGEAE